LSYEAYRRTLTPVLRAVYRLDIRGRENVPVSGPLVVTGNHDSILDPFVMAATIERPIHFLGKSEFWRYAPVAWWLGTVGAIPVVRRGSDATAIASAVAALEAGEAVGLFPEGALAARGRENGTRHGCAALAGAASRHSQGPRPGFVRVPASRGPDRGADRGRADRADG
jgi:1-acyl-sn-glycerol-3-phosphate acyltransferase